MSAPPIEDTKAPVAPMANMSSASNEASEAIAPFAKEQTSTPQHPLSPPEEVTPQVAKAPTPPPKPPTPPPKAPTPPPPLPELPAGLAFALDKPLIPRDMDAPFHALTLLDGYNPVIIIPRWKIEPNCPLEQRDVFWCPAFQISAILGHSDLQQLKYVLEEGDRPTSPVSANNDSTDAGNGGTLTNLSATNNIPLSLHWRQLLWRRFALWQTLCRRYKYENYPGTGRDKADFADQDGWPYYRMTTDSSGIERFIVSYVKASKEARKQWEELQDGTQTYWVPWWKAKRIVEQEILKGGRLEGFSVYWEELECPGVGE